VRYLGETCPELTVACTVRTTSKQELLAGLHPNLQFILADTGTLLGWQRIFAQVDPATIVHLVQLRQVPDLLTAVQSLDHAPRLIIIGTTGVLSRHNQYAEGYQAAEMALTKYAGKVCLLRPTMIYGSYEDKNLHKLIQFCDRYGFFPVFGSGQSLLQPVHADDLAKALLSVFLNPKIQGTYDLSGGTVVTFLELLTLVEKLLDKPVYPLHIPYQLGVWFATLAETILGNKAPVRREQILRLQEDKAYSHEAASKAFGYAPRSLKVGLAQEIKILRAEGIISS